jgi:hypothetical protein
MTREEREKAIDLLDNLVGMIEDNQDNDYDFALKKGIEALKQEDVIDKIRAEIAELHLIGYATVDGKREIASRAVLQILDKYKAESEDKE